MGALTVS